MEQKVNIKSTPAFMRKFKELLAEQKEYIFKISKIASGIERKNTLYMEAYTNPDNYNMADKLWDEWQDLEKEQKKLLKEQKSLKEIIKIAKEYANNIYNLNLKK